MNQVDLIQVASSNGVGAARGRSCLARFAAAPDSMALQYRAKQVHIVDVAPSDVLAVQIWRVGDLVYRIQGQVDAIGRRTSAGELIHAMAAFESAHGMTIDLRALAVRAADLRLDIEVAASEPPPGAGPRVVLTCDAPA